MLFIVFRHPWLSIIQTFSSIQSIIKVLDSNFVGALTPIHAEILFSYGLNLLTHISVFTEHPQCRMQINITTRTQSLRPQITGTVMRSRSQLMPRINGVAVAVADAIVLPSGHYGFETAHHVVDLSILPLQTNDRQRQKITVPFTFSLIRHKYDSR